MNDFYLDDIYMYGTAARDINYLSIQKAFPETSSKDTPANIYGKILANSAHEYSSSPAIQKKVRKLAKRAKFPLKFFLAAIITLATLFIVLGVINHKELTAVNILLWVFGAAILAIWPAIIMLIYGATIRDKESFINLERAHSSDVHILKDGSLAIIKHCYDYPKYDTVINPKGQLMPISAGFVFDYSSPVTEESQSIEDSYQSDGDIEIPFSQAFIVHKIHEAKLEKDLIILSADCEIYSIIHPSYGTMTLDDGTTNGCYSKWLTCHHGKQESVRLVLPAIDELKKCVNI